MTNPVRQQADSYDALLRDYSVSSHVADELTSKDGAMRPVWKPFIENLARLSPQDVEKSFARGDQYLRDAGVFYRQYSTDSPRERAWPLSHIPVLLSEVEWEDICAGLAQRADLLEHVVADLYGAGQLVRDGHLPPELIARNPEWLRPLVGSAPASGHFLHFLAFEIGRSPDGSWLVLGDRAQAPSGAGFALENRRATSRVFPDPFPRANIRRLAGFYRAFRDALEALPGMDGRGAAILTPGPGNDTYFEHAYIARYLGLPLLEGDDLIVEDGQVQVRTVAGPQPIGALWRRLDAAYTDPLELDEDSHLGTPGLVEAVRQSNVNIVNALGSGILETRALMAFLPKIADVVLGQGLRLPNLATWWCGQPAERDYVKANLSSMFVSEAASCALPFDIGQASAIGGEFRNVPGQSIEDWIDRHGPALVGQEAVSLSTTPAWVEGRLVPRPMTIRVFAARTPLGWQFLPGGYARIGRAGDTTALSMQKGGSVADVWIMRDEPVVEETMLGPGNLRREDVGALPSRAAENLYWLGRYVERTEGAIRLLRAYHLRLAEGGGDPGEKRLARIAAQLAGLAIDVHAPLLDVLGPPLDGAGRCAGRVRDRFSVDGWAALTDLTNSLEQLAVTLSPGDDCARALGVLLRKITGFKGLVHENMQRSSEWRLLTFGRALERADGVTAVLQGFVGADMLPGLSDLALEFADSRITHQRRYRLDPTRETVTDLLALDRHNPRSILFQVIAMRDIAQDLPFARHQGRLSPVLRALLRLETDLAVADPVEITPQMLAQTRSRLADISRILSAEYLV